MVWWLSLPQNVLYLNLNSGSLENLSKMGSINFKAFVVPNLVQAEDIDCSENVTKQRES